jgi:hypothetical protein
MKKTIACALLSLCVILPVFSAASFNANDLDPAALTASKTFDAFTIKANEKKGVTIEAIDLAREAKDGEVFNVRIKLNGSGKPDYRAIAFTAKKGEKATIYLNSSSKTDARELALAKADGTVVATIAAPLDNEKDAGMGTYTFSEDGTYCVYSKGSGINIYAITIK